MKTLKSLLIQGPGPSSSHTIGPFRMVQQFLSEIHREEVEKIDVTLYGSLALTGKGHFTDRIIEKALHGYPCEIHFDPVLKGLTHPNTMTCAARYKNGTVYSQRYLSIGGGAFMKEGGHYEEKDVYPFNTFSEMTIYMEENKIEDMYELVTTFEDPDIFTYGKEQLLSSFQTIERSLEDLSLLPGELKLKAVSNHIRNKAQDTSDPGEKRILYLTAYAYATAEANARGDMVITAPTCGSAGVVPAVLYYEYKNLHVSLERLVKAYLVGALVCDFIKQNASLSGALLGCQAEIGSAASFAASSLCYLNNLNNQQIEYGAEVAMEHFLGLTCDPVNGYVQIPCIERNAMASIHAYASYLFAKDISAYRKNRVSFDNVIKAMRDTGDKLSSDLKETSLGGLAKVIIC